MKITIEETTTTKKEIDFKIPCYRKDLDGDKVYKIIDGYNSISVYDFLSCPLISINMFVITQRFLESTEEITKQQFKEKFNETLTRIKNKI